MIIHFVVREWLGWKQNLLWALLERWKNKNIELAQTDQHIYAQWEGERDGRAERMTWENERRREGESKMVADVTGAATIPCMACWKHKFNAFTYSQSNNMVIYIYLVFSTIKYSRKRCWTEKKSWLKKRWHEYEKKETSARFKQRASTSTSTRTNNNNVSDNNNDIDNADNNKNNRTTAIDEISNDSWAQRDHHRILCKCCICWKRNEAYARHVHCIYIHITYIQWK